MEKIPRATFIRLAAALGVGAASASVAACGGDSSGGSGNGSNGDSGGGAGTPAAGTPAPEETSTAGGSGGAAIAQESEVAPGSAVEFQDGGEDAVLVHLDNGDFVAYSAVCTHAGCTVAYRDAQLACPCHGSVFDPANGAEVVSGPADAPLPEIPVEVRNGEVLRA